MQKKPLKTKPLLLILRTIKVNTSANKQTYTIYITIY